MCCAGGARSRRPARNERAAHSFTELLSAHSPQAPEKEQNPYSCAIRATPLSFG